MHHRLCISLYFISLLINIVLQASLQPLPDRKTNQTVNATGFLEFQHGQPSDVGATAKEQLNQHHVGIAWSNVPLDFFFQQMAPDLLLPCCSAEDVPLSCCPTEDALWLTMLPLTSLCFPTQSRTFQYHWTLFWTSLWLLASQRTSLPPLLCAGCCFTLCISETSFPLLAPLLTSLPSLSPPWASLLPLASRWSLLQSHSLSWKVNSPCHSMRIPHILPGQLRIVLHMNHVTLRASRKGNWSPGCP